MKDFDCLEIRAARRAEEVDNFFWQKYGVACRPVVRDRYSERIKAVYNKIFMRKGEEEL